ncbi:SDR family NAD(P)-dependent oxidoreductase [soil metagenome]
MADRVLLVTGASSDIGLATIRAILASPDAPTVLAHSFRGGEKIQALQAEFGERVRSVEADFTDAASVRKMADDILAQYGAPHSVLHLPALRLNYERFTKFDWQRFESDLSVQVQAAVILLQRFLPKMAKMQDSRVVFVLSSVTHGMPPKFLSMYTMLKYTQLGLMRALAAEYAATSVRINGISPSMVQTQFLGEIAEVAVEMSAAASPQGRNAVPQDLVGAIQFLLSPAAGYITGADLPISAGSVC